MFFYIRKMDSFILYFARSVFYACSWKPQYSPCIRNKAWWSDQWSDTLTGSSIYASLYANDGHFTFDAGLKPQSGQEWDMDQDITIFEYQIHIKSVIRTAEKYNFIFEAPDDVRWVEWVIEGADGYDAAYGNPNTAIGYSGINKTGNLKVMIANIDVRLTGN